MHVHVWGGGGQKISVEKKFQIKIENVFIGDHVERWSYSEAFRACTLQKQIPSLSVRMQLISFVQQNRSIRHRNIYYIMNVNIERFVQR